MAPQKHRRSPLFIVLLTLLSLFVVVGVAASIFSFRPSAETSQTTSPANTEQQAHQTSETSAQAEQPLDANATPTSEAEASGAGVDAGAGDTSANGSATTDGSGSSTHSAANVNPVEINVFMVGDILIHSGVWASGDQGDGTFNFDHLFSHIAPDLAQADLKILDQETILGGTEMGLSGYPSFNSPQEVGVAEAAAGFNMILRASNHSMDMGNAGIRSELSFWRDNYPNIEVVGAVMPEETTAAEDGPHYYEKDGFKIAVLNYTYDLNGYEDPSDAVCEIDWDQIQKDVTIAENTADLTIVCPHWGEENSNIPTEDQRALAQAMAEWGADLILGNHPHVIQPVELITLGNGHQVPVYWSVGNFVSTMLDPGNMIGGMAKVRLVKDGQGARVTNYGFEPIVTHQGYGTDMTTYPLREYTDDLAWTTTYQMAAGSVMPEWVQQYCSEVLGEQYDPSSYQLSVSLDNAA